MSQFDEAVAHTIKHFALHRLDGLEWRVISDVDAGVIAIAGVEESVLTRFMALPAWPHSVVTFFVLRDLSALQRQLESRGQARNDGKAAEMMLPAGGIAGLAQRPVVNLYDLANPETCHVFVNHAAMQQAGYWGDVQAETALLAHEHAHPLVENGTVQSSRQAAVSVRLSSRLLLSRDANDRWLARLQDVTQNLVERLCRYAPRELFTNSQVIASGFQEALCYLDRLTIARSAAALIGRQSLVAGLQAESDLTDAGRLAFLMLADLQAHLEMAFEVASFRRQGAEVCAGELEQMLYTSVLPGLAPDVGRAFATLTKLYAEMGEHLTPAQFVQFTYSILAVLVEALAPCGIVINHNVAVDDAREG